MIPDSHLSAMQEAADAGLEGAATEVLAGYVNDLLDERRRVMLPEIKRLTDERDERADELARMAASRDEWRRLATDTTEALRATAGVARETLAAPQGGSPAGATDAVGEVRAALLAMPIGSESTWGGNGAVRGRCFARVSAIGWETDVHINVLSIEEVVAHIMAHGLNK